MPIWTRLLASIHLDQKNKPSMRLGSCLSFLAMLAAAATAVAQTPAPLAGDHPGAVEARMQLEAVLACRRGAKIDAKSVEAQLTALGLVKGAGGVFQPARDARPTVFGADAVAAAVWVIQGETKALVYLRGQKVEPLAKKLGANKVDKEAGTDQRSYFRRTSNKTTLQVGAAADLDVSDIFIKYQSSVACRISTASW